MGRMVIQRILECNDCGKTPEDGEKLWEMCGVYICEKCIEKEESETEEGDSHV